MQHLQAHALELDADEDMADLSPQQLGRSPGAESAASVAAAPAEAVPSVPAAAAEALPEAFAADQPPAEAEVSPQQPAADISTAEALVAAWKQEQASQVSSRPVQTCLLAVQQYLATC